jgi:hypothetical protein
LRSARVLTGALLLGAVGAAMAPAGPDALVPFKLLAASAADDVYVAVVIDFGTGSHMSLIEECVPVPATTDGSPTTDAEVLADAGNIDAQYSASSGLLCEINNYPVNGVQNCNATANGQYYFWSYWHGNTGDWSLAGTGPGGYAISGDDVEGWRFQNPGPITPTSADAPEATPDYASICAADIRPPTTTPPVTDPTPDTVVSPPVGTITSTTRGKSSANPTHSTSALTTSTLAARTHSSTTVPSSSSRSHGADSGHHHKTGLATAPLRTSGSGGTPILPIALVGAVIVLLAGFGYFRWRQRPAEE